MKYIINSDWESKSPPRPLHWFSLFYEGGNLIYFYGELEIFFLESGNVMILILNQADMDCPSLAACWLSADKIRKHHWSNNHDWNKQNMDQYGVLQHHRMSSQRTKHIFEYFL